MFEEYVGSIVGPTLFNSLFNDFFLVAATHNYEKKKIVKAKLQ